MKFKKLFLLLLLIAAAGAGAVVWQFINSRKADRQKQPGRSVVAVETAPITVEDIHDVRYFTGTLSSDAEFIVSPRVTGWARKIFYNVGAEVLRGAIVAQLDDEEFRLEMEQAAAELDVAKANLAEAEDMLALKQSDFLRATSLANKRIISDAEFERIAADSKAYQARKRVTEAQVKLRQTMLESAKVKLSYTAVTANWDSGSNRRYVGERFVNEGSLLQGNTPLMTLVDLDTMKVVVNVVERDIPFMFVGQKAKIRVDAFKGEAFDAEVIRISPVIKEKSRQGVVELTIDNAGHKLKPGMFVTAELQFSTSPGATVMPVTAKARRNETEGVFVVKQDSTVKFVPVKGGVVMGGKEEVLEPKDLRGDVVVMGHHLLEDGAGVLLPAKRQKDGNAQ
jgi:RND family efflux transporter MFP subunit